MALTSRRGAPLPRIGSEFRDSRLFVILSEASGLSQPYFSLFADRRIHQELLGSLDGESSPERIIERLDECASKYQISDDDQLWVLLDSNRWLDPTDKVRFCDAMNKVQQKGYRIAMSNPCFDLWLLLHHGDLQASTAPLDAEGVEAQFKVLAGYVDHSPIDATRYPLAGVQAACARAKALEPPDVSPDAEFWLTGAGARVYVLVEKLRDARLAF